MNPTAKYIQVETNIRRLENVGKPNAQQRRRLHYWRGISVMVWWRVMLDAARKWHTNPLNAFTVAYIGKHPRRRIFNRRVHYSKPSTINPQP